MTSSHLTDKRKVSNQVVVYLTSMQYRSHPINNHKTSLTPQSKPGHQVTRSQDQPDHYEVGGQVTRSKITDHLIPPMSTKGNPSRKYQRELTSVFLFTRMPSMIDIIQYVVKNKAPGDNCELLMVSTAKPPLL